MKSLCFASEKPEQMVSQTHSEFPEKPLITMIVLSHNRPEFLYRKLRYLKSEGFQALGTIGVHVSGTDDKNNISKDLLNSLDLDNRFSVTFYKNDMSFQDKVTSAIRSVNSPYAIFAADDDFYFSAWINEALKWLEADSEIQAVYGNFIEFETPDFKPFTDNELCFLNVDSPNGYLPYLEDSSYRDRLDHIGSSSEFITVGWYALNRTEPLKKIFELAADFNLSEDRALERYFNFCHSVVGKTKMIRDVYLARQFNNVYSRPLFSLKSNLEAMSEVGKACASFLRGEKHLSDEEALLITERALENTKRAMEKIDKNKYKRLIADNIPFSRHIWRLLYGKPKLLVSNPRLPFAATRKERELPQLIVRKYASDEKSRRQS